MTPIWNSKHAIALTLLGATACASAARPTQSAPAPAIAQPAMRVVHGDSAGIARARADSMRLPYTAADVHFMTHMIGHHAQAIAMSRLVPTRASDPAIQRLAARIINAQQDEIVIMQQWLADRLKPVPEVHAHGTAMPAGGDHSQHAQHMRDAAQMRAPGMLTEAQMKQLEAARGKEFDRLFLTYMIQHHRGAVQMVQDLLASPGAAQDETVFRLSSDVNVDQTTEIARMEGMLGAMKP